VIERTIAATTHGRYLVAPPAANARAPLLVGFHGYAEGAEAQLERMRRIPGVDAWRLVAIQGLHRFYHRRAGDVVASWMTRQDRELAIADNVAYVNAVVDEVTREWPDPPSIVYAGFSQGVAMTFRAAAASPRRVAGVIAVGGDVPPELHAASLAGIPAALICRGVGDAVYPTAKFDSDIGRLRAAGAAVTPLSFDGGHEWSEPMLEAAAAFLRERTAPAPSRPASGPKESSARIEGMIEIRSASPADAAALAELRWEFRVARAPATEAHDVFVGRCETWMRAELTSAQKWRAWVAVVDGAIVGQVWMQTIEKMPNPIEELECHAYVSNVFVQPAFRGGIGGRLLEAALAWARSRHVDRVVLWPWARSVTLYERHGFTRSGDVMELALGPKRQ